MTTTIEPPLPITAHSTSDRDILRERYAESLAAAFREEPGAAERALMLAGRLNAGVLVGHDLKSLARAVKLNAFASDGKARKGEAHALAAASREVSDADNALQAARQRVEQAKAAHRAAAQAVTDANANADQLSRLMESKAVAAAFEQVSR